MGGRGMHASRDTGGRGRDSRPGTKQEFEFKLETKPRNAMEYTQQQAAREGFAWSEQSRFGGGSTSTSHTYGTFTKGDVSIGVQYSDRARSKGRINDVAVRKNGQLIDYFGHERKDKRKAMRELFRKYG